MSFIRNDIKPILPEHALSTIAALSNAETVGDILSLSFPLPVISLAEPERFARFYSNKGPSYLRFKLGRDGNPDVLQAMNLGVEKRVFFFDDMAPQQVTAISETTTAMMQVGKIINASRTVNEEDFRYAVYASCDLAHGDYWHTEVQEVTPESLLLSVSSANGTMYVAGAAFHDILKNSPHSELLTSRINDRATIEKIARLDVDLRGKDHPMHAQFQEAAERMADNVVNAMPGILPHRRSPEVDPERVIQIARRPMPGWYQMIHGNAVGNRLFTPISCAAHL